MRKRTCVAIVSIVFGLLILAAGVGRTIVPAAAAQPAPVAAPHVADPQDALRQAWERVREAGSYRYLSTSEQTLIPRPIPQMIGESDLRVTMENDGAVLLPDLAYFQMRVAGAGQDSRSATILRDASGTYMLRDEGELVAVSDGVSLANQTTDLLGYLAGAEQVTVMAPPPGHPELARYGFRLNGERFEEYVREQTVRMLAEDPSAPDGLQLRPSEMLRRLKGHGELWVNASGLPVRQVLDMEIPEANESYDAEIRLVVDISGFGQVEALPRAVQSADGAWTLEGTVRLGNRAEGPPYATTNGDKAVGSTPIRAVGALTAVPLAVDRTSVILLVVIALAIVLVRYYRRNPRRCYALIVIILLPIMVFSSLLQAGRMLRFVDKQVQAAEKRQAATPELLQALGVEAEESPDATSSAEPGTTGEERVAAPPVAAVSIPSAEQAQAWEQVMDFVDVQAGEDQNCYVCGCGTPGRDTDADGLADTVENCLGTNPDSADSDDDGIDDYTEVTGFDLPNGTHWDSDPRSTDSNRDGMNDVREWSKTRATKGQAVNDDVDGDNIPNLWDDDDDGDGVPDAQDLSPYALTDYTDTLELSTGGDTLTGTMTIEFEIQPRDLSHLRYTTTALDWPDDDEGNVQDLDMSENDLRLLPFLRVRTNVQPDPDLAKAYNLNAWADEDGDGYILLVPLQPVEDAGAMYSFYGKVAYAKGQSADIQWEGQLVWVAQMQSDSWGPNWQRVTKTKILHIYQEELRLAGLQISKSHNYEATVMGTPTSADDRYLFQLYFALNDTFLSYDTIEGQSADETMLEEIYDRFTATGSTAITHTWGIDKSLVAMPEPRNYESMDLGLTSVGDDLVLPLLTDVNWSPYYDNGRCIDTDGHVVNCATLLLVAEHHEGVYTLAAFPKTDDVRMADLSRLHVQTASIPLMTLREARMRMYEHMSDGWQVIIPERMLDLVEARYHAGYGDVLADLYPELRSEDGRFLAYTFYLYAYAGRTTLAEADGRPLLSTTPREDVITTLNVGVDDDLVHSALDYVALAAGMALLAGNGWNVFGSIHDLYEAATDPANTDWIATGNLVLGVCQIVGLVVSIVFNALMVACDTNSGLNGCHNELAIKVTAGLFMNLVIAVQTCALVLECLECFFEPAELFDAVGFAMGCIGTGIGALFAFITFGVTMGVANGNPITVRMAVGTLIITLVWLVIMVLLSLIPIVGGIIVGIIDLIDAILSLFSWLFGDRQWTIAQAWLEAIYSAQVCTQVADAQFHEYDSGLRDHALGFVAGNVYTVSLSTSGVITKTQYGTDDDLELSYTRGALVDAGSTFAQQSYRDGVSLWTTFLQQCRIVDDRLECANSPTQGYVLDARINGLVTFRSKIDYQTVWGEFRSNGKHRWAGGTNTTTGTLPDNWENYTPAEFYLDVLPDNVTALWQWSALKNYDSDGDGLIVHAGRQIDEETALGTDPTKWDTDGDGLSDKYEMDTYHERGNSPLLADTDGDGLTDDLERRAGTRADVADTDGDGRTDGQELRHLVRQADGSWILEGGWDVTLGGSAGGGEVSALATGKARVTSDPLHADDDEDGLNASEEAARGLSPHAVNLGVPALKLKASPLRGIPGGRFGTYWLPGEAVTMTLSLANGAENPVTTTLTLDLPYWLDNATVKGISGDRKPSTVWTNFNPTWSFAGGNALQVMESTLITVTGKVGNIASATNWISATLPYGEYELEKGFSAVVDGDNPHVAILAPGNNSFLSVSHYVVGGVATDGTTWVTGVDLSIVPQGQATAYQALGSGASPWAKTWSNIAEGAYTLQARASDPLGHVATTGITTVTIDRTPPSATLAASMSGTGVQLSGAVTDDRSGVARAQLAIDGQPWRSVTLTGEGTNNASWTYTWTVGQSAQGDHEVHLRAYDRAGNESGVISRKIVVDKVAPSSSLSGGAETGAPPAVKASTTFTLTGVADEGGHLPLPVVPGDWRSGMDVFADAPLWLGLSSIRDNDGGVLAAWAGDFNADRMADLAVGLPGPTGSDGWVAILYGQAGGWAAVPDLQMLADAPTRYLGAPGVQLGSFLAAAGDANADNLSDLLIGERSSARAFLVFGNGAYLGRIALEGGKAGYRTVLQAPATIQGLASAGDVNGDGYDDILVRAGGKAYLVFGRLSPWPETLDLATGATLLGNAVAAAGVGDVDKDQLAEWVLANNNSVALYGWDTTANKAVSVRSETVSEASPRVAALGDVDGDGAADWLYAAGSARTLVYGAFTGTHTFTGYDGLFAAPGDVDGDKRSDILLATSGGVASLIRRQAGEDAPEVFATISGVGGAANAPYAAGADLNSDGSSELLLIPSQAAAEAKGFDAPAFSGGFISPQALPQGMASPGTERLTPSRQAGILSTTGPDTRYVDDDAVNNICDGHSPCYTTIQAAVDATDGGGDTIIVYPGAYAGFRIPADAKYNNLTVQGVDPDAVFVEDISSTVADAIQVAADGVRLANMTVRNVTRGLVLEAGAGLPTAAGGSETFVDRVLVHSAGNAISMSQDAALTVRDSTLVGDGVRPALNISTADYWRADRAITTTVTSMVPITTFGTLASAGSNLYALPGGENSKIYQAAPGAGGALGAWSQPFSLRHALPTNTGTAPYRDPTNVVAGSGDKLYQLHGTFEEPKLGNQFLTGAGVSGEVMAVAVAPNGDVYIGGHFTKIGTLDAFHIARWDGSSWHALGSGVNGVVRALAFDNHGNLYVGGDFTTAGGKTVGHVAGWDGTSWWVLGAEGAVSDGHPCNGVSTGYSGNGGSVKALVYDTDNDYLWIGGVFDQAWNTCSSSYLHANLTAYMWHWQQRGAYMPFGVSVPGTQDGGVTALAYGGYKLYVGGGFTNRVGSLQPGFSNSWTTLGTRLAGASIYDIALGPSSQVNVATGPLGEIWQWNGETWNMPGGQRLPNTTAIRSLAVLVDSHGNVIAAGDEGHILVQYGGTGNFEWVARERMISYDDGTGAHVWINDLALASDGRVYSASNNYCSSAPTTYSYWRGFLSGWAMAGFFGRSVPSGNWSQLPYPPVPGWDGNYTDFRRAPNALAGDGSGNLYAVSGFFTSYLDLDAESRLAYYDSASASWTLKANPPLTLWLKHLVWADGKVYALGHTTDSAVWHLYQYDPAADSWAEKATPSFIANGANSAAGLSMAWDGGDYIYVLAGGGSKTLRRYSISANSFSSLTDSSLSFGISYGPAMARIGSQLYVYATPGTGATTNVLRYGPVGTPDLRLTVERTAFVAPETASSGAWIGGLSSSAGAERFLADIDTTNRWVGPSSLNWSPSLPSGATKIATAEAKFVASADGLYRVGYGSSLGAAGYRQYVGAAHVYTSQAACAACESGDATWGVDAHATIREAVESGATRVLVHPGRYPQTFYLVSGVEVLGSGAETTILSAPAGTSGTLVTAEGVAASALSKVTLAGRPGWTGFLAEGGAQGITLSRNIVRDLGTGIRLRGGSQVEVVNNTLVRNTNGIVAEGANPVNVRNSILAYNTGTGLSRGASSALANTYNDYYGNGTDMDNLTGDVGGGKLYRDPRFRDLAGNDLRLAAGSPVVDMGAPSDPTPPGTGTRADMGYAEYNAAGFYAGADYSATGLNDGLTWGVDAFDTIQDALDAAEAALRGLQGALPEGGYSVGVDSGVYTETVTVPSHVRLVGSGANVSTLNANSAGSAVTFDGVVDAGVSGFRIKGAGAGNAGVALKNAANGITIARNIITGNAEGVSFSGGSSGAVSFNTIADNTGAGVVVDGTGAWAEVRNNIVSGQDAYGLQATGGALIRNDYNLFNDNTSGNLDGVAVGEHQLTGNPAFAAMHYYLTAASPALDAAEPLASVPTGGGLRADLGYKELIASPLTMLFGPQIDSTVTGNSGVAKVEVGVRLVTDATQPVTATLPVSWSTVTANNEGLYTWKLSQSQATAGLYRVYSKATDAKGNAEADTMDWYEGAFVVDNTPPAVAWGTPALPASTSAAAVLAVATAAGTVTTGAGTRGDVKQVYFSVTGAATTSFPAVWDGSAYRAWIPLPAAGSYTIVAVAVDEAGNQAQATGKTVAVSAATSVATVISPADSGAAAATAVSLRGYARFTAAGAGAVAVSNGTVTTTATLESPGAAFSAWSADATLAAGDGAKTLTVTPSLGGVAGTATTLSLTLDTAAPTLSITAPAVGTTVTETVAFKGTASDTGSGLARVDVSVDGGYTWTVATGTSAWSLNWTAPLYQDYVSYPARVRVADAAGNVAEAGRVVTVDNAQPTGIAPLAFTEGQPLGQHLDINTSLSFGWTTPVDAGGPVKVYLAVDQHEETIPTAQVSGTSSSYTLNAAGDWYVHLMAQDAIGNQAWFDYGPWHVRDMSNSTLSARRQSIIVDGYIDLARGEWRSGDLLGTDAQGLETQKLYATWDGQAIYLGWSGAWWTLDGSMWAYLDVASGGSAASVGGGQTLPFAADLALFIDSPTSGGLYTWNGSSWGTAGALDFAHGSTGDSEARIAKALSAGQSLRLVALALPRAASASGGTQASVAAEGAVQVAAADAGQPWAIFPNTNPLGEAPTVPFEWTNPVVAEPNDGQPSARTVRFSVTSPQPSAQAWCPSSTIEYDILLENPEDSAISLALDLAATTGLAYQTVTGATLSAGQPGERNWTVTLSLGAGAKQTVVVAARTATGLGGLAEVGSTIALRSTGNSLTGDTAATITHRLDAQAPTVSIDALPGAAVPVGSYLFTGVAGDVDGSGVAKVEVSTDGSIWSKAVGALNWSAPKSVPGGTTYTLYARAVDSCGKASEVASQTFNVDSTPPAVQWTLPAVVTSTFVLLDGTTSDPNGGLVASVELQLDKLPGVWVPVDSLSAPSGGAQRWLWNWAMAQEDGVAHTVRARATDAVGNIYTEAVAQETVVDTVKPRLTVSQAATTVYLPDSEKTALTGGLRTGEDQPHKLWLPLAHREAVEAAEVRALLDGAVLNGTVSDGAGVKAVRILVYDPLGGAAVQEATLSGSAWEFKPDTSAWALGSYTLRVQAVDNNGNARTMGPYALEVLERPVEGLVAANDGPHMFGEEVTLQATTVHGSNLTYAWAFGDGKTGTGATVKHTYATAGEHTAQVIASNSAGSVTAETVVTILALTVEAGADQEALEGDSVAILAQFGDERAGVTHTATLDWGDGSEPVPGTVAEAARTISGAHVYQDNGAYKVVVSVSDGTYTATDSLWVTARNVAPTATLGNNGPQNEGAATTVTFTAAQDRGAADTLAYSFDWNNDGVYEIIGQAEAAAAHTWWENGVYTVAGKVQDDDGGFTEYTTEVTVGNAAPATSVDLATQNAYYGGAIAPVTYAATDVLADTVTPAWSWRAGDGAFGNLPAWLVIEPGDTTEEAKYRTVRWVATGTIPLPAGSYTLRLAASDEDGGTATQDATVVVQPKPVAVIFDGNNPVAVKVATAGGSSEPFALSVCVSEKDAPPAGDISLAQVSMSLAPVGPGSTVDGTAGTPTVANGKQCLVFAFNAVPVNTYTVQVAVGGAYYTGAGEDVLVVYDPSLGFTTGGGWFYWPDTADTETDYLGDRTNFGYTMKYNKKGENVQGSLLLIRHLADGTIYRVKSNALYGLALGESAGPTLGWASFSGKSNYQEPSWPEPVGNYEFKVYVEDRNEPGIGVDRFWIEVLGGLSMPREATMNAVPLGGGNIVAPHKPGNDTEPPVVAITSPANGATLSGELATIIADATSTVGVAQVEFYIDGVPIDVDTTSADGWSTTWKLTGVADGAHTIRATATATDGQTGSHSINVTVDNVTDRQIRVAGLTGSSAWVKTGTTWKATVVALVDPALTGAVVSGAWSTGATGTCTTGSDGRCTVVLSDLNKKTASVTYTVGGVARDGYTYDPSDAGSVTVTRP